MLPGAGPLAFLLRCLLLLFASESRARARPEAFCDFNGKKYSPGESWHPYLEPQGLMYCIRCSCAENTSIRCSRIQCPALPCASPVTEPQQCCPRCPEPPSPSGLRAPARSCRYNGTTFQQGEMFSGSELFPGRQPNQCVQCSCSEGQIYCGLVTCPELLCSSPFSVPDSCCQVCKDGSLEKPSEEEPLQLNRGVRHSQDQCLGEVVGRKPPGATVSTALSSSLELIPRSFKPKGPGGTTVKIVLKEKHKKACVYNGKTYSHGEVWHPVFRLYGLLPCILCTCRDGVQDCHKLTCPKEYPCQHPEKVDGKCCKECPESRVRPTDEAGSPRCGGGPGRVLVYAFVPPRSEPSKDILRTVAIERELAEEVEIYNWKLIKGIFHLIQTKKISKQEFKQEAQNFRLITRTNEGHWNIFRAQMSEMRMTESPEKETKTL
ncbi:chordin-like protein 2 [Ammospiza nelsoni]|uniref:chordin-like protein 2 n=1 Tax=Ammospiza caudacuta TaxID=2857398 RepID=UPI0027398CA7|nr:chordin-like protein 2 [Ammospiza caudacuta]XP_059322662.1 chordin-like protein 2 [Ammospiza nelsoni]